MEYKVKRERKNNLLSIVIVGTIVLLIGIAFIPLTFIEHEFSPTCIEAYFMYIIFGISGLIYIYALYYGLKFYLDLKKDK